MGLNDFASMTEREFASYMNARNARVLTPSEVDRVESAHDAEDFTPAERMAAYGV
jgi:hypothetical protein